MDPRVEIREMIQPLNAFAHRFYRDPYDVEDLVQETLLRALANIDSYTPGTRMKSWLFTIMRNTFYNRARVYEREKPAAAGCASERGSSDATQDMTVEYRQILSTIRNLPLDQKEVVVLVAILGITYNDASEICGCRLGTVQSRLHRARSRLGDMPTAA
jgi:RNA polymerase sigma factor (sigma-70 family)